MSPFIEALESRRLLSVATFPDDFSPAPSTSGNDIMYYQKRSGDQRLQVVFNGTTYTFGTSATSLVIKAGTGNDGVAAKSWSNWGTTPVTILGEAGNDTLQGANGSDSIEGSAGADYLWGSSGYDTIVGGDGIDTTDFTNYKNAAQFIDGSLDGVANDYLYDGSLWTQNWDTENLGGTLYGADTLVGGSGANVLSGSGGDDSITSAGGNDTLYGGDGNDYVFGESYNDLIYGDAGNDSILGGSGNDTMYGGDGNDYFDSRDGVSGNDYMYGEAGTDTRDQDSGDFFTQ